MPNPFFMLFFLAALMLALKPDGETTAGNGGTAADRERIADLSAAWLDAYVAGDIDRIAAITHHEAVIMPRDEPTVSGAVEIRDYVAGRPVYSDVDRIDDPAEVRISGKWAYTRGRYTLAVSAAEGDTETRRDGRYLLIFEKGNGGWKLLRGIDNAVTPPAG